MLIKDGIIKGCGTMTTNHKHLLSSLLAVIHRDGGHYEDKHGTEKAVEDAMEIICDERLSLELYRSEVPEE